MTPMISITILNFMMRLLRASLLYVVVTFVGLSSCTEVDYNLGVDLMPETTDMFVARDTLSVKSYSVMVDSIVSDVWSYGAIGSYVDPVWGGVTASTLFQVVPSTYAFSSADTLWGVNCVIDSVFLSIYLGSNLGDTLYDQVIDLYNLTEVIPYHFDSTYYSNFDPMLYADPEPFASIDFKYDESDYVLPIDFAQQYLDTVGGHFLYDSLFVRKFPGIYMKPRSKATSGGLLSRINNEYSSIVVYYHNENPTGYDTTYMSLTMTSYDGSNKIINIFENDLSLADPVVGVDTSMIGSDVEDPPVTYVRSFATLMTRVELLESEIERIRTLARDKGYTDVAISNATLVLPLVDTTASAYNRAPNRLGMYYEYETSTDSDDYWYGISDTDYAFDGYLSRSLGEYRLNITSYVQRRFAGEDYIEDQDQVDISVGYDLESENVGVFLKGAADADDPMEIELTYVMVK